MRENITVHLRSFLDMREMGPFLLGLVLVKGVEGIRFHLERLGAKEEE